MLVSLKKHPQSSLDIGRSATDLIRYAIWLPLAANAVACLGVAGATKPLAPTARSARATPRNIFRVLGRLDKPARPQRLCLVHVDCRCLSQTHCCKRPIPTARNLAMRHRRGRRSSIVQPWTAWFARFPLPRVSRPTWGGGVFEHARAASGATTLPSESRQRQLRVRASGKAKLRPQCKTESLLSQSASRDDAAPRAARSARARLRAAD